MLANWIKATTTTTGTGTVTLSAVSGYPRPSDAIETGIHVQYTIKTSAGDLEAGIGTVSASNTLTRDLITSTFVSGTYTSVSPSAISLPSGTHEVIVTPTAANYFSAAEYPQSAIANTNFVSQHIAGAGSAQNCSNSTYVGQQTAYPFVLKTAGVLTGFACQVSVLGASDNYFALYQCASNGAPGKRIAYHTTAINTGSTGYKTVSAAANVRVTPGVYWMGWLTVSGTSPSLRGLFTAAHPFGNVGDLPLDGVRNSTTGQTSLSDPFPTVNASVSVAGKAPAIGILLS
jgi:hypothetical protein